MPRCLFGCCGALVLTALSAAAAESEVPVSLNLAPSRIVLDSRRDQPLVNVQATYADGSTRDVTTDAKLVMTSDKIARIAEGVVTPLANGQTELVATLDGLTARAAVEVKHVEVEPPVRFRNDVLAVLTRAGCNTGKCHGSASGKDGFRLSLFGYDPAGDHYRLTRELPGRRINLAKPEDCLLINKALAKVPHTGGKRLEEGTAHYETVMTWLTAGAPADPTDVPVPMGIEVLPKESVFASKGEAQRLIVMARYSDGSDRDVTDLAVFISNNDAAATVTEEGVVTGTGPGASFILARFDQFAQGASIVVRPGTDYTPPEFTPNNYIDELVAARWHNMHLTPSPVCSDEVFLRRVSIDLTGLLPTPEQRETFLVDADPNKRAKLVDTLLEREEFLDQWIMKFAEILQIRTANGASRKSLLLYDRWLRSQIKAGATIDQVVAQLLPATGGTFENPATSYYQTETTPQLLAENIAQALLGTRIQCAQCHNHPFDRWTMDDYYGFAAFFSQVGYKQAQDPRELTIFNTGIGEMKHPLGGQAVTPRFLGGNEPAIQTGDDYRQHLSQWLTSPENTAFTQNIGNIIWAHFLGVGIVDPVDDVRVSNPPSNAPLLQELGRRVAEYKFDIRKLARDICTSQTYQLATQKNASNVWDSRNFSHARIRRLRAENLLDCITQVTETTDSFSGLPSGSRAVHIADGRTANYFLSTFGRASRNTPCTCEVQTSPTLSQALHLLNGETTSGKIAEGEVVERLIEQYKQPLAVAEQLYVRCFSRMPTDQERAAIQAKLATVEDEKQALVDLFWALLNSNEFIFNH